TINSRANLGCIKPWQAEQHDDRTEHHQNAAQLRIDRSNVEGDSSQHGVEWQIVPLRNDRSRRHQGVSWDIVVWVAKEVWHVEHEPCVNQKEYDNTNGIFQCRVWCKWNCVRLLLHFNASWVRLARHMQRPDVQNNNACN